MVPNCYSAAAAPCWLLLGQQLCKQWDERGPSSSSLPFPFLFHHHEHHDDGDGDDDEKDEGHDDDGAAAAEVDLVHVLPFHRLPPRLPLPIPPRQLSVSSCTIDTNLKCSTRNNVNLRCVGHMWNIFPGNHGRPQSESPTCNTQAVDRGFSTAFQAVPVVGSHHHCRLTVDLAVSAICLPDPDRLHPVI